MDSALRAIPAPAAMGVARSPGKTPAVPLFSSDRTIAADPLGRAPAASLLAELALHAKVQTPLCIGLAGPAGIGKSAFLGQVLEATERLAAGAAEAGLASAFVGDVVVVRIEAGAGQDPDAVLAGAIADGLAESHPALAADLQYAGADPQETLRTANAGLDAVRRTLSGERQTLDTLGSREARLAETVLDTPGSLVDLYARSKRAPIERTLRQFGFAVDDPIATFKALVREAAEQSGTLGRIGLSLRALYGFSGQRRLLFGAAGLAVLAWLCGFVRSDQGSWIRAAGEKASVVADGVQAHLGAIGTAQTVFELLAVLLLLLDVIRAARFVLPISRGVDLLQQDLEGRGRELAGLIAHQTRRVDTLNAEAEAAARFTQEAEKRATRRGGGIAPGTPRPPAGRPPRPPATAFFADLATAMAASTGAHPVPRRLIVAIDGLDQRPAEDAARLLAAARRLFGPGIVTLVAGARSHLQLGFGETDPARALAALARCIDIPYQVGAADGTDVARRSYAMALIDGRGAPDEAVPVSDPCRSVLDVPWQDREAETVAALALFAGDTPRAVKRYVNLYRVARADPRLTGAAPSAFTTLALALAFDAHGLPEDLAALDRAASGETPPPATSPLLRKAVAAAREASGTMIDLADAQRAMAVAESYTSRSTD